MRLCLGLQDRVLCPFLLKLFIALGFSKSHSGQHRHTRQRLIIFIQSRLFLPLVRYYLACLTRYTTSHNSLGPIKIGERGHALHANLLRSMAQRKLGKD